MGLSNSLFSDPTFAPDLLEASNIRPRVARRILHVPMYPKPNFEGLHEELFKTHADPALYGDPLSGVPIRELVAEENLELLLSAADQRVAASTCAWAAVSQQHLGAFLEERGLLWRVQKAYSGTDLCKNLNTNLT